MEREKYRDWEIDVQRDSGEMETDGESNGERRRYGEWLTLKFSFTMRLILSNYW